MPSHGGKPLATMPSMPLLPRSEGAQQGRRLSIPFFFNATADFEQPVVPTKITGLSGQVPLTSCWMARAWYKESEQSA